MNRDQQQPPHLDDLIADLDLEKPLHEWIEDGTILEQPIEIEPEELARLDALAREYAQELLEKGLLPEVAPLDLSPDLLETQRAIQSENDIGR